MRKIKKCSVFKCKGFRRSANAAFCEAHYYRVRRTGKVGVTPIGKYRSAAGKSKTVEYRAWFRMMRRCYNVKDKVFKYYGARGIAVCDRWHNFDNFFTDIGIKKQKRYSLERIDNSKGYSPGNCKWALPRTQARNRRGIKLNLTLVREIRALHMFGFKTKVIAIAYQIDPGHIRDIVYMRSWASISQKTARQRKKLA